MPDASAPVSGDVVLSHSSCARHARCYAISVVPGPAQVCIHNRAQAIAYATGYAARTGVDAWLHAEAKHTRLTHEKSTAAVG